MKKITAIVLAAIMVVCAVTMVSCNGSDYKKKEWKFSKVVSLELDYGNEEVKAEIMEELGATNDEELKTALMAMFNDTNAFAKKYIKFSGDYAYTFDIYGWDSENEGREATWFVKETAKGEGMMSFLRDEFIPEFCITFSVSEDGKTMTVREPVSYYPMFGFVTFEFVAE